MNEMRPHVRRRVTSGVAIGMIAALAVPLAVVSAEPGDGSTRTEATVVEATTTTTETTTTETTTTETTTTETPTTETTAPPATETRTPVTVGPAAPGDTYDVSVDAVCDPGFVPAIHAVNLGTGTARVSVGSQSAILAGGETWDLPWPTTGRDPIELDPNPKWDAVDVDAWVVFEEGVLSLPPDCPPSNVPGAPTDVVSRAGDGTVELTWTAPTDGGAAIEDYTVEHNAYPVEDGVWTLVDDGVGTATTLLVDGLTNGETYLFRIAARNANGPGPWAEAKDTPGVVPGVPVSLVAAPTLVVGQVRLTWSPPVDDGGPDVFDYVIERSSNGLDPWLVVPDGEGIATTALVSGLTPGVRAHFRVKAVNQVGTGGPGNAASAIPVALPGAPRSLVAAPTNRSGEIRLAWLVPLTNGGLPITDYVIQRSPNGTTSWTTVNDGVNVNTAYTVTGLANGTRYYFRILAATAAGRSAPSNVANAVPRTTPSAPRSLVAAATGLPGQVRLSWVAPLSNGGLPLTDYVIQRSPNGTSSWTTITDGVNVNTAFTVTGLVTNTRYYFRVFARNGYGTSPPSTVTSAIPRYVLTAPRSLTAAPTNRSGQVRLAWVAPLSNGGSAITDYVIQRSPNGTSSWTTITDGVSTSTTATISGLSNGVRTYFRVMARTARGTGPASAVASAIPRTVPSAPRSPAAAPNNLSGQVRITWLAPSSTGGSAITDYVIQRSPNGTSSWTTVTDGVSTSTSATVTGLTNGVRTYFRVFARNAAGLRPVSATVSAVPRTVPGPLPYFYVEASPEGFYFEWDPPLSNGGSPITGYRVQYLDDRNIWVSLSPIPATWRDAFLDWPGEGCGVFRMAAMNAAGTGPFTAAFEAC